MENQSEGRKVVVVRSPRQAWKITRMFDFVGFNVGDLIFTNHRTSIFARLIRFAGILSGVIPVCNHVEMYTGAGKAFSADRVMTYHNIDRYFRGGHDIYFYRDLTISADEKNALVAETRNWVGLPYDILGIVWQVLDTITGKNFSEKYNHGILAYCSELVQRIYKNGTGRSISDEKVGAATPSDIRLYVDKLPNWECVFKMVKIGKSWTVSTSRRL